MNYKFCPKCGGKLNKKTFNMLKCSGCGFEFYLNPCPCNAAILENDKNQILLIKRKLTPKKGFWDLPGGFIDIGETIEQSIIREIKEEIGVELKNKDLDFFNASYPDRYLFQGINFYTLCFIFTGNIGNTKVKAMDDAGEVEWVSKDKLPFGKFAFESMEKVLKDYIKISG